MRKNFLKIAGAALFLSAALPLASLAQENATGSKTEEKEFYLRPSYWRPYDQRGINVFETTKEADPIPFEGLRIRFGAGFTQQFQNLKHESWCVF